MLYALVLILVDRGTLHVEQRHMSLQSCAGRAAMLRIEMEPVMDKLTKSIGRFEYRCMPERLSK